MVECQLFYANSPTVCTVDVPPNITELQRSCQDFAELINYMETGNLPANEQVAKRISIESNQYVLYNDVLYHLYQPRTRKITPSDHTIKQLAVPASLREDILLSFHDSTVGGGHQGFDRTYNTIRMKYYWPRMYVDVEKYVQSCEPCQKAKRAIHSHKAPLQPLPVVDVFQRWHMDILGPLTPSPEGFKYILLVVDSFSKWPEAFPLHSQEATEIAKVLYSQIFCRYGAPNVLVSDRGQNFMSKLIKALSELFQITRHHTSAYHPQTNAACERYNSSIAQAIRAHCGTESQCWASTLPAVMMAYRLSPAIHTSKFSPYFLLFGREMRTPIDNQLIPKDNITGDVKWYLDTVTQDLEIFRNIAKENIVAAREKQKALYDQSTRVPEFTIGDRVWLYCRKVPQGISVKLFCKWTGPYYICASGPNFTFKLRNCKDNKEVKSLVHSNRLKIYFDPQDRPNFTPDPLPDTEELSPEEIQDSTDNAPQSTPELKPPSSSESGSSNTGSENTESPTQVTNVPSKIAERLLKCQRYNGKLYYKVKWEDHSDTTWELEENISDFLKQEFHISKTLDGKKRKRPLLQKHKYFTAV
ncbi:hypothetical protein BSL78_09063 [Apostichopus japonicus]|uniref:Retrovirus-related Pol polyprotein from transposon n=1 Tax=Stichopus japonicus TaxID=307972 RepID=A0A2G8L189_STIJA|nr:hypothetical protein BSL78_09063 [Apostichopus japonicus]